tara:strand:+ start:427 stop:1077 length:651 start_codon:yes stop_codon:yes gene_type:complete
LKSQIIFSGIDGCGKSTQIELLKKYFENNRIKYKVIWMRPGSTPILLIMKNLARKFFTKLPTEGRSREREKLMKKSYLGKIWLYLSLLEIMYIAKVESFFLRLRGFHIIYDRHLFDAIIDYKISMNLDLFKSKFINYLLKPSSNALMICLDIPLQTSRERCKKKYEPFPDTDEEKVERYNVYNEHIPKSGYIKINGLHQPDLIHTNILKILQGRFK